MFKPNQPASRAALKKGATAVALAWSCLLLHGQPILSNEVSQSLLDSAEKSAAAGSLAKAEQQLRAALKEVESSGGAGDLRFTIGSLTNVLTREGKFSDVEALLLKLIAVDGKSVPQNDFRLMEDYGFLGDNYHAMGKLADAEAALRRAIALGEKHGGTYPTGLANAFVGLGVLYQESGRYDQSEEFYKRAIAISERSNPDDKHGRSMLADGLMHLGSLYIVQCKLAQGEPLLNRSLQINEEALGAGDVKLVENLDCLGRLAAAQGKAVEAETYYKRALSLQERALGSKHPDVAKSLILLADFYRESDNPAEAVPLYKRAIEIERASAGDMCPALAIASKKLGLALMDQDRYDECETQLSCCLNIDKECFGATSREYADDLSNLALNYLKQGKYESAEPLYTQALAITRQRCGEEHPDTATCMNNLALLYRNELQYDKAVSLVENAMTIRRKAFGNDHPSLARNLAILAELKEAQGDWSSAESLLKQALDIELKTLEPEHPDVLVNLRELARVCENERKWKEVEACGSRLVAADEKLYGKSDPRVVPDLEMWARAVQALGDEDKAKTLTARASYIKDKLPGALTATDTAPPSLTPEEETAFARPVKDKWAVVIGISNFKDSELNLKYAAKDATDFKNYLIKDAHFQPDHIKLLTDRAATREHIVGAIGDEWLKRLAHPDDLVVIYVSTHGSQAMEQAGGTNFIVPYDATIDNLVFNGIPMQWITAGIKDMVHSDRVVLVMDVCHAGAVAGNGSKDLRRTAGALVGGLPTGGALRLTASARTAASPAATMTKPASKQVVPGHGEVVLTASKGDQISWESTRYPNGVFTRRLIDALRGGQQGMPIGDAFKRAQQEVEDEVLRDRGMVQQPVYVSQWWKGGDMNLALTPTQPHAGMTPNVGTPVTPTQPHPGMTPNEGTPVEERRHPAGIKSASGASGLPPAATGSRSGLTPAATSRGAQAARLRPATTKSRHPK